MRKLKLLTARLIAAQTPDEAFRLVSTLRSRENFMAVDDKTLSESLSATEHAYMAVGRHEGTAILVSILHALRFGPLTAETKARIEELSIFHLRDVAERLLNAQTLNEALDVERWSASEARAAQELFGPE